MNILALETSSTVCSVALLKDDEIILAEEHQAQQHALRLLPLIDELLHKQTPLEALAWGCGPGSFTGLRIGAAAIQALGLAHQLPVISVSSLAALAQLAYADKGWTKLLVAVDARMGEVYWGCYTIHEGFALLQGVESVSSPQALELKALNLEAGESYFGVGSGWHVYSAELEASLSKKPQAIDSEALPKASGIAHLAAFKYKKGEFCDPVDTLPVYLRDNIANTQ